MDSFARLAPVLERSQGPVLRGALGLPPSVQRVLAGPAVVVDGQRLDTELQLALRLQRLSGFPAVEELPVPEGRRMLGVQSAAVGAGVPVGSVRHFDVTGAAGPLRARLYTPTGYGAGPRRQQGPAPLLVWFHGGGWVYGDLDSHDGPCRFLAEESGIRVLSIEYRLAPEHPFPAAHDDAVAAYRWVVERADELDADPGRIGVGGDSAGGTLAATTAIAAARSGLPCAYQLLVYPATEMTRSHESHRTFAEGFYLTQRFMDLAVASYLPRPEERTDPRASPHHAELPDGLAPAYLCTAGFDPLRDEGEAYARKLAEAGTTVELKRFTAMIHGFVNWVGAGRSCPANVAEVAARLRAGLA